ncbi:hypothetical protein M9H77_12619 [Catharanthus roseus]|uniref:Uncharacterized protein n=1 Tax=Catharanthus roseus TaxID=4058 RepID=A0ACC0BHZ9_CATRO|nr:hypothetical protein M9H77_12619 [Catharanthus roseus]
MEMGILKLQCKASGPNTVEVPSGSENNERKRKRAKIERKQRKRSRRQRNSPPTTRGRLTYHCWFTKLAPPLDASFTSRCDFPHFKEYFPGCLMQKLMSQSQSFIDSASSVYASFFDTNFYVSQLKEEVAELKQAKANLITSKRLVMNAPSLPAANVPLAAGLQQAREISFHLVAQDYKIGLRFGYTYATQFFNRMIVVPTVAALLKCSSRLLVSTHLIQQFPKITSFDEEPPLRIL